MAWLKKTPNRFLLTLALCHAALTAAADGTANPVLRLTDFEVTRSDNDHIDAAAEWTSIHLPDSWSEHAGINRRHAWYRTLLPAKDIHFPLAVYIPRVSMNAAVIVNGVEIGNGGRFTEPITRNHGRPLLFFTPLQSTGTADTVSLTVHVADNGWALGYLGPIYVGDPAALTERYRVHEFWQVHVPVALALVMLVFAAGSFALSLRRRHEKYYFWFGAAMLLLAIDTFNVFVNQIPMGRKLWEIYNQGIIFAFATATILFIHRFTGIGWKWMEPVLGMLLVAKIGILLLVDSSRLFFCANIVNLMVIGYGAMLFILIVRHYLVSRDFESGLTAVSGLALLSVAFHTWLIQAGLLTPENQHLMHFGAPGFFLLIGFSLLKRFLTALDAKEQLANELEQRVHEKEQELAQTYAKIGRIKQLQALSQERERIMREMHDGVGGQLVGALAILESDRRSHHDASELLRASLLDLRVMIDSLDSNTGEISVALGMLRTRIDPILRRKNISLGWDVQQLPEELGFNPNDTLNILRILQELITNIVKHSTATQIMFRALLLTRDDPVLLIDLWEDGDGFDLDLQTGKGLRNIRERIRALHATIDFVSKPTGFVVEIRIPHCPSAAVN